MGIRGWFRIRGVSIQSIAFSLQRLTGIILLIYLVMHLSYLTSLRLGKEVYTTFISLTVRPETLPLDSLLFLVTFYHAFNGIRVVLHEFGILYTYRKALTYVLAGLAVLCWIWSTYVMYTYIMG